MPEATETPNEEAAAQQPAQPTEPVQSATDNDGLGDAGKKALDAERDARKAAEKRAKDLDKELETFRKSSMSEAEKAIAEAKTAGRAEAVTEFGKRLARTEFDAAAGRRNPEFDSVSALEWVDLSLFVGEDGEPNTKAIQAAVERLVPAPASGPVVPKPDPSQGARPRTAAAESDADYERYYPSKR